MSLSVSDAPLPTVPKTAFPTLALVAFTGASFLSAFLLFLLQPLIAKMILPRFGGVPAVWNTCQLFFQAALLAGYGYSYFVTTRLSVRGQVACHLVVLLLPVLALPIAIPAGWEPPAEASPIGPLLGLLAVSVGLPFVVVATTAPLLQRWYAASGGPGASDPYFLYAMSNLGSLLALLGYPLVIEPNLSLAQQGVFWAGGFGAFAVLCAGAGLMVRAAPRDQQPVAAAAPAPPERTAPATRAAWVALAFVPSSLLLGVTTHVTTDIAPIPLLWVIPLALYLLSFVLAFLKLPNAVLAGTVWVFLAALAALLVGTGDRWTALGLHLLMFFAAALMLHGELARRRPPVARLTEFYVCMSVGGVLGGLVNAIAAPVLLTGFYEYRAAMVLACLLVPAPPPLANGPLARARRLLPWGAGAVVAGAFIFQGVSAASRVEVLYHSRNFFGVLYVINERDNTAGLDVHRLVHGTTDHGVQVVHSHRPTRRLPRTYYYPTGPIGQVFVANLRRNWHPPVAVVGLGAGSLASYAAEGQEFDFFEIDPAVVAVAENPRLFTFLSECPTRPRIVVGDARLTLARQPARHYGLVVVDAFSSDAIPVHLLTAEAADVYLDRLTGDGLVAFHISNNYLDLVKVLDGLARVKGLHGLSQAESPGELAREDVLRGKRPSHWVVLARTPEALGHLAGDPRWAALPRAPESPVWTDDYSNVLGVLRRGR